ncbi:receptor-like protein kinase ANXUR2 [Salvia miltiorrhiza]|uniref:receptor-like protein kinase ANXUR2 n=1 Tax=Salvia miltiorrhiza TaxID=226208 RepID=UPI0025AC6327|nr:receptor-like protein kinase ANXUR2 [Salvia miltiorrhiza]XP_057775524.1 receptor-like protein kinase ANXUR2 [Salvia miltiorrhiza]
MVAASATPIKGAGGRQGGDRKKSNIEIRQDSLPFVTGKGGLRCVFKGVFRARLIHFLAYLHEEIDFQAIFRDFKSSIFLLDEQWNAKLTDYGLAWLGPPEGRTYISTMVVGSMGHATPERIRPLFELTIDQPALDMQSS